MTERRAIRFVTEDVHACDEALAALAAVPGVRDVALTGAAASATASDPGPRELVDLQSLVDGLPLIVWVHDERGEQQLVNRTFCEFFGIRREEARGHRWRDLMHAEDAEAYGEAFEEALRLRQPFHAEVRVTHRDGEWRWLESWGRPRFDRDGAFRGLVGTSADVTERRRMEDALREAHRRKDEFLAMLGHELRNPLAAIQNATDLLALEPAAPDTVSRLQSVLSRQSDHMARLIDGLLDVSRIERGKIDLRLRSVDFGRLIRQLFQDHVPRIEARGLQVAVHIDPEPVWVVGDLVRLRQVVDNLVWNALRFTEAPGRLEVHLEASDDEARLRVRDTGVGIRPSTLGTIFEPFHQEAQGMARDRGGLGLGLALVKAIVELHRGTVEAWSEGEGRGAEFTVRLPRAPAPTSTAGTRRDARIAPRRILLVEDQPDIADMLKLGLERRGHEVTAVRRGHAALALAREREFDAILCDVGLPGMDGYAVARALRRESTLRAARLVAVTGYGRRCDAERAARAGFDAHLVKPVRVEAIERALRDGDDPG